MGGAARRRARALRDPARARLTQGVGAPDARSVHRWPPLTLAAIVALVMSAGCSSGLVLDGRPFDVATCGSGQIWGFLGVDLVDREGRRLFVAWTNQKRARVTVFEGPTESVDLGLCGEIDVTASDERDRPYAVSGDLEVACDARGHTVRGTYSFDACR